MNESKIRVQHDSAAGELAPIRRLSLPRGDIAYFEQGDPKAPLVLLQHGFPDYPKTFFPLMARLSAKGYRCVAPFLRGYAPSTTLGPFHQKSLGEDLADIVRSLSPDKPAVLVGHDWGAIATYAAIRHWPQLFHRAVTLAVPHVAALQRNMRFSPSQQRRSAYIAFLMLPCLPERVVPKHDFAFVDALWRAWSPGYEPSPEYMSELKRCLQTSMPAPLAHYRALRPAMPRARASRAKRSARIIVPVLHLHGSNDGCIAFEAGAGQERYFESELRSENLPGLGHFLQLEDAQRVAARILDFLEA
jgi:pimeloyl-ACP methyl ester carboxylesterase